METAGAEAGEVIVAPGTVESALARIEGSAAFRPSRRHRVLLRHLVTRAMAGDHASLKESVLAVEVFGRSASGFDPRLDTIVRVETRRLRQRLAHYFRGEGQSLPLRIELPVGSYVPLIAPRSGQGARREATRRARDLVERGQFLLHQPQSQSTLWQALARFDEALRESPESVAALVGAARAWLNLGLGWYADVAGAAEHAREALERALALDPRHAEAHALMGSLAANFERDAQRARRHLARSLALDPQNAFAHLARGMFLLYDGDFAAAEEALLRARALDPMYVNARRQMVNLRLGQGRLEEAQAELDGLLDIAPDNLSALAIEALLSLERGHADDAVAKYRRLCERVPGHANAQASLAAALGAAGRVSEADEQMAEVTRRHGPDAVSPYVQAIVALRCGRAEQALERLRRALDDGDPLAVMLVTDPSLRPLHAHPRWAELVAQARQPRKAASRTRPAGRTGAPARRRA